jgi:hypothetical protein
MLNDQMKDRLFETVKGFVDEKRFSDGKATHNTDSDIDFIIGQKALLSAVLHARAFARRIPC